MSVKGTCFVICLILFLISQSIAQELKLAEVISKHAASIGTVEKRKELKNIVLLGFSVFESKLPQRKSAGKLAIVSDKSNLLFISSFTGEGYPFEKIGIFEGKINVPFVSPGIRSPLGDFLWEHPGILKSGLFSGSMSLTWSLLEENLKKGKLKLAGTKKIDGRKAYVIEYFTEGNSDSLKIRLYFDAETFQHIRSQYREEFAGKEATFGTLGQINGYVVELTETFGDFKTSDGITLPNASKVRYMGSSSKGTYEYDRVFKVTEAKFNQPLKEGFFNF
ncbi:MAG: hypothetical protein M3Q33_05065 [Acidobacteriota bacterium]|nr:hypothetical protein [Acidobacteriota bacterium]